VASNSICDVQCFIVVLLWGWIMGIVVIGVRRGLRSIRGTFNCRFEAMGNKVYFDIMKLLLPFCVFEFEVVVLVIAIAGQWIGLVLVIIVVIVVELLRNGFVV
jgi:hypothetical protein